MRETKQTGYGGAIPLPLGQPMTGFPSGNDADNSPRRKTMSVYSKEELLELFKQVGLPFDEVESGSDGVIAVVFATDDKEYNE